MAKNLNRTSNANVSVPLPVPAGTLSGHMVPLGAAGFFGWALTDRVTTAILNDLSKNPPQGLKDGEASIELPGVHTVVNLTADATGIAQFAKVYWVAATKVVSATASGNTFIGYALDALAANGRGRVALMGAGA